MRTGVGATVVVAMVLAGCTGADDAAESAPATTSSTPSGTDPPTSEPEPPAESSTTPPVPARFEADAAMRTVRHLASDIGPRQATSPAYARAANWVQARFERLGYDVERHWFRAPAGNSWGIDVPAGRVSNVIATAPGFDPSRRHRIVGAHLDTVPQAPGAEDNASGVATVLELARMAAAEPPRLPVMFVAFGAEEPRGDGDALHHFGSRAMVERLDRAQRRALVAMVALDRVGVGRVVPLASGGLEPPTIRAQLARAAAAQGIATVSGLNQTSDHWSFDKAGLPAARVGSTPYAGYHSASDVPSVVNPAQLQRVGQLMWTWLNR